MGMGKTIQAISLILQNRPSKGDKDQSDEWDRSDLLHDVKDGASMARAGTLLVLPTVAIRQWQTEIARFTRENCLKVIVYHGNSRSTSIKDITAADVVITSYKVETFSVVVLIEIILQLVFVRL